MIAAAVYFPQRLAYRVNARVAIDGARPVDVSDLDDADLADVHRAARLADPALLAECQAVCPSDLYAVAEAFVMAWEGREGGPFTVDR
jgi:hypothetical protein